MKPKNHVQSVGTSYKPQHIHFYVIAFIEGASVMAIELAGAKMIAPYYGSSLYVWAAVLAVTLGGLTTGYFLGGRAAYRFPGPKTLFSVLLTGAVLILLMPFLSQQVMPATGGLGIRMGSLVSASGFMLLPLVCMGMVSPLIIQLATRELKDTGKTAGTVYAVSTVGGILMTMIIGFYLLPEWGIKKSVFLTGGMLGSLPVIYFLFFAKKKILTGAGLVLVVMFLISGSSNTHNSNILPKIQYQSEGILGQLTVFDYADLEQRLMRVLLITGMPQTRVVVDFVPLSAWQYPHRMATLVSIKPKHSKALLIGMGGGNVAMELTREGFDLDIVDIDKRMPEIAEKYFGFKPQGTNITIDDGRHYFKSSSKTYDLIILDILNGDVQPFYFLTKESFTELKQHIAPDALLLINFQGYLTGEHGLAARSIYKTLLESGFKVKYFSRAEENKSGDILFIASLIDQDFHAINPQNLNPCCRELGFSYSELITEDKIDLSDAIILTDDKPQLEILNAYWNEEWRTKRIQDYGNLLAKKKIPLFQ